MSPLDIPKLTPVNAASSLRAKDGNTPTSPERATAAAPITAQTSEGVKVELGAAAAKGGAPVDAARVEAIREALREGTYPIVPTRIADALIAARFMLGYGQ